MALFDDVLLTVDFDRTLTAQDSTIPQANLDAIEYFMANGGTFTVNTGRSIPMSQCFLEKVPTNAPFLMYNGSVWYDAKEKKVVRGYPIEMDPVKMIRQLMDRFPKLWLELQGVQRHYLFRENKMWEAYNENNSVPWAYGDLDAVEQPFLKVAFYSKFESNRVSDLYQVVPEEMAMMDEAMDWMKENWGDKLEVYRPCPRLVDVQAKSCSKLKTARDLQAALGKKILVCVGDAENDLAMLEGADYAFCPSDGIVADRFPNVCPCGEGAVAAVIREEIPALLK